MPDPIPPRWGRRLADRPFSVRAVWVAFAHREAASLGNHHAARLMAFVDELTDEAGEVSGDVSLSDPALVKELVAVAERIAADPESGLRQDPRLWFRLYAANIAKRGKQWLRAVEVVGQHG